MMAPVKKTIEPGQTTVSMVGVKHVPVAVLDKLQTIASIEQVQFNEVYNLAFVKFIETYEKANGKIKIKPKGKGLENL